MGRITFQRIRSSLVLSISIIVCAIAFETNKGVTAAPARKNMMWGDETRGRATATLRLNCTSDDDCPKNSICRRQNCVCEKGWLTWPKRKPCSYEQRSKSIALVVSILLGGLGVDWFVLARGSGSYILAGIIKMLMSSGCCAVASLLKRNGEMALCWNIVLGIASLVWWIVDWVRILVDRFPDGNGAPLVSW